MKTFAKQNRRKTPPRARSISAQAEVLLIDLFRWFGELYGDSVGKCGVALYDGNGELSADFRRWCRYLAAVPIKDIRQGCERIRDRWNKNNLTAPPTCAEFLKIATADWRSAAHQPFENIPQQTESERKAARIASREALQQMRSMLGKS